MNELQKLRRRRPLVVLLATLLVAGSCLVLWGPRGYVLRSNLAGMGWTRARVVQEVHSPTGSNSIVLIRLAVPQDGPAHTCVVFNRWFPLPLVEASLENPPLGNPRSSLPIADRRFEVEWVASGVALVRMDGWAVAYLDYAAGRAVSARVDLSLKTRNTGLWVEEWRGESARLANEARRYGLLNSTL